MLVAFKQRGAISISALGALIIGMLILLPANAVSPVTLDQLNAAGFTSVMALKSAKGRFAPPVLYFKVKDSIAAENGWGDASNIVSVLVVAKYDSSWQYNSGQIEIRDISGRTQARVSGANNYIVVTGPNQQKVAILAHDLSLAD